MAERKAEGQIRRLNPKLNVDQDTCDRDSLRNITHTTRLIPHSFAPSYREMSKLCMSLYNRLIFLSNVIAGSTSPFAFVAQFTSMTRFLSSAS
jgi:hypothetical protein